MYYLDFDSKPSDIDDLPYTTLLYGNGPGYGVTKQDGVISGKNTIQAAAVPRVWATHGGEDVPIFATGPLASIFRGVVDQTFIPHAISYITCLDRFKERCGCLYFNFNCRGLNSDNNCTDNNCNHLNLEAQLLESESNNLPVAEQMRLVSYADNNSVGKIKNVLFLYCFLFLINMF